MIKEESRFGASNIMEGMTSVSALLSAREAGLNDRPINEIRFDRAKKQKKAREYAFLARKCAELSIPLTLTDAAELEKICIGNTHGGIVALCGERTLPLPTAENLPESGFLCLLEGIEDPYNFGYALRSLYAAGVDGVVLENRNWMSAAGVVCRSSAGASERLPMYTGEAEDAVKLFKANSFKVICAGIRDSVSSWECDMTPPVLLIVGGEKRGISSRLLSLADSVVRLDYGRDYSGSLSAASAASILAYEVLRQTNQ